MKDVPMNMMEIIDSGDSDGRKTLSVIAPWEQISADYSDIVDEYSRVRIAGYRAGRAPRHVVEKRFQREIMNELLHRHGGRLGREALSQAGIEPLGPVEIANIECMKDKPFKFTARFYPMPEIEMPALGSFTVGDDGTDPKDMISNMLLQQVSFEVPDELTRAELGWNISNDINTQGPEWKAAVDRVRLVLILKKIARQEGIEVDEADVERRIGEKAAEFGTTPDILRKEFEQAGGTQRLKDMLLAESTLEFLIEKSREQYRSREEEL
jgi:FKBP-type peptidyl-prolyl cis-trans isomerase (trigger factor)